MSLDEATQRLVEAAVAAAPPFTSTTVANLKRILRPETLPRATTAQPVVLAPRKQPAPQRRAA